MLEWQNIKYSPMSEARQIKVEHTFTCTHIHPHTCMHAHIHTCPHTHTRTHARTHARVCMHAHMHSLSLSFSLYACIRVVCTGNKNRWLWSTFGPWTMAYIPYSLAKRTYYLRVKKLFWNLEVLTLMALYLHQREGSGRSGWLDAMCPGIWPSLCGLITGGEWRQFVSCHCLWSQKLCRLSFPVNLCPLDTHCCTQQWWKMWGCSHFEFSQLSEEEKPLVWRRWYSQPILGHRKWWCQEIWNFWLLQLPHQW